MIAKVNELKAMIEVCSGNTISPPTMPTPQQFYSPFNWTSVPLTSVGTLNFQHDTAPSFTIPSVIPSSAREVLIHAGVFSVTCIKGLLLDIKVFTQIGTTRYEKYLLLNSCDQAATNTNFDNMWFPMPPNRRIYLTIPAVPAPGAHGRDAGARLFAIGYR